MITNPAVRCLHGFAQLIETKHNILYEILPHGFANASDPSRHFTRRIDVMWLHILSEPFLRRQVEFHHGVSEGFRKPSQLRYQPQNRSREGSIDLKAQMNN